MTARGLGAALPWLAAACALSAPPAEQTLAGADALDARVRAALATAAAATTDAAAQLDAAATLFQAADLRVQRAAATWLDANPAAPLADVLDADDHVPDDVRTAVASLCTRGLELAERADRAGGAAADARLLAALHVSLLAWANGPTRALFAGFGPRTVGAIDAAVAAAAVDPGREGAGALRLSGRFRDRAPWPYRDRELAERTLARAVELAPFLANHLFYGDVLARLDRTAGAAAAWRAAIDAPSDPLGRWSADLLRGQARARLRAAGAERGR
jgi:hypothetical protein